MLMWMRILRAAARHANGGVSGCEMLLGSVACQKPPVVICTNHKDLHTGWEQGSLSCSSV